jgi:hypothetical protein
MRKYKYKIVDSKDVEPAGLFKGNKREDVEAYLDELGKKAGNL